MGEGTNLSVIPAPSCDELILKKSCDRNSVESDIG